MKSLVTEYCELEIHNTYVILTVKENVNLTLLKANEIRQHLSIHYNKNPFVLINNRKYSYNFSRDIYKKRGQLKNLEGIAFVSTKNKERELAFAEQKLFNKSFAFFEDIETAKSWAEAFF